MFSTPDVKEYSNSKEAKKFLRFLDFLSGFFVR